jgi:hypothetical protein
MTQRGPSGECLRCLVSLGVLPPGEPSAVGTVAHRQLTPGPRRYAHFEVEVGEDGFPIELGAGAMAVTYRARDTVLNSVVALKVIDRKAAENPAARSRFLREARAAAQLHHPNVARVDMSGVTTVEKTITQDGRSVKLYIMKPQDASSEQHESRANS